MAIVVFVVMIALLLNDIGLRLEMRLRGTSDGSVRASAW
jgi:hypothetical protein